MENDIAKKLYEINLESEINNYDSAIKLSHTIANKKLEAFGYVRNNQLQYCEWSTVREYISFAQEIGTLNSELKRPKDAAYRSEIGFKDFAGDKVKVFLQDNGCSVNNLKEKSLKLFDDRVLPTTEKLYEALDSSITSKNFKWSLTLLQIVQPLALGVCRKWIWIPNNTFDY